jgi:23S rRNA (cytosine1962-C5)-methyltransferase
LTDSAAVQIRLKPGADRRARHGYPWVYSNEIEMTAAAKAVPSGTVVDLAGADGRPLGPAYFNSHSLISARTLGGDSAAAVTTDFYVSRLRAALGLRDRLFAEPFYRLVHAEADGLPGLVVDRFGDTVVIQINAAGPERHSPLIQPAVDQVLAPSVIVIRRDGTSRSLEGLDVEPATSTKGALDSPVALVENGHTYYADVLSGQKTGWFYDHRDNRAFMARLAKGGRVLDVYTHTGGFAIAAGASGVAEVLGLDRSEPALDLARRAAEANGLGAICKFERREAFEALEELGQSKERFDIVIADPPAFVKSRKDLKSGLKGYRKLARLAAAPVAPGGFLMIASCSHNVSPDDFAGEVARGLGAAGRSGRLIRSAGAGPDHPVHPLLPETAYLKALVFQLD